MCYGMLWVRSGVALGAAVLLTAQTVHASFHLMQIEEIMGGVNGDTSAQAIQLRMRAPGQNFLHTDAGGTFGPASLVAKDANGGNPVTLISFPNDVANGATGGTVLISSTQFAHDVSPGFSAANHGTDFTFTNLIPASYLAAGRIDYLDGVGDVLWSVSYGGANYHGSAAAASFNGAFGSPFGGPIPSGGLKGLLFQGTASAAGTSSAADYALTSGAAGFANNSGSGFAVTPEPASLALFSVSALGLLARRRTV